MQTAVYCLDADRIARDVAHRTIILGELRKCGKQIISRRKDYANNSDDKCTATVRGAVAEAERLKLIRGKLANS